MTTPGHPARRGVAAVARLAARLPLVVNRRWPPLRQIKALTLSMLRVAAVEVDGFTVHLDATDSLRLGMGDRHEPKLVQLLPQLLRRGDVAVDGGAHIGYLTLVMARAVGPEGSIHAFEPEPANFNLLTRNLSVNRADNVVPHCRALWSSSGRRHLFLNTEHHADHRLWDPGGSWPTIEVETCRLDNLSALGRRRLRLIKLDLQGAELEALRGAEDLLARNPEVVLALELWPRGLGGCGASAAELVTLLADHGFQLYRLPGADSPVELVDARQLLRDLVPTRPAGRLRAALRSCDWVNLIAKRRERSPH